MDHLPTKRKKERGDSHREPRRGKDTTEPELHKIRPVSTKRKNSRATTDIAVKLGREVESYEIAYNCHQG